MATASIPARALTQLALKYGHPLGPDHSVIADGDLRKSGLTPVIPLFPDAMPIRVARSYDLEDYQRAQYFGLTTTEIDAVEALAPTYLRDPGIERPSHPIHPFFEQHNWNRYPLPRHLAKFPLGGGNPGYWEASNPVVWNAIYPSLQLVNHFLENVDSWPWWDALANGEYSVVESYRLPPGKYRGYPLAEFRLRDPAVSSSEAEVKALKARLHDMAGKVDIQITCGRADPENGLPYPNEEKMVLGHVEAPHAFKSHTILYVAFEIIEPLVKRNRANLKSGERAVDIHRLACLLLHQTVHAFWEHDLRHKHSELTSEPYFEDEITAGLGYSLENAIFGGVSKALRSSMRANVHSKSAAGGVIQDWNTVAHIDTSDTSTQRPPQDLSYYEVNHTPIPVGFYLDLVEPVFWDYHFHRFGTKSTIAGPKTFGTRAVYDPDSGLMTSRLPVFYDSEDEDSLVIEKTMSRDRRDAIELENDRRRRRRRINKVVKKQVRPSAIRGGIFGAGSATRRPPYRGMAEAYARMVRERQELADAEAEQQELNARRAQCLRFGEIQRYLMNNRNELALDTMSRPMGEHILYNHILQNGGLTLTPDEWHNYLLICHRRQNLFSYLELGPAWGVVTRIATGWLRAPIRDRPVPPGGRPSDDAVDAMVEHMRDVLKSDGVLNYPYQDHDWEDFRRRINLLYARRKIKDRAVGASGQEIQRYSSQMFNRVIHFFHFNKMGVTYGPTGVLRWNKGDGSDADVVMGGTTVEDGEYPEPPPVTPPLPAGTVVSDTSTHVSAFLDPRTGRVFNRPLRLPENQRPLRRVPQRILAGLPPNQRPLRRVPQRIPAGPPPAAKPAPPAAKTPFDPLAPGSVIVDPKIAAGGSTVVPTRAAPRAPIIVPMPRRKPVPAPQAVVDPLAVRPPAPPNDTSAGDTVTSLTSRMGRLPEFTARPRGVPLAPSPYDNIDFNMSRHSFFPASTTPGSAMAKALEKAAQDAALNIASVLSLQTVPGAFPTSPAQSAMTLWPGGSVLDLGLFYGTADAKKADQRPETKKPEKQDKGSTCRQQ